MIRTRKPTGIPPWPLVLIEGPEKSGKSFAAAQFTASDKIGQAYWIDLGEGAADEYAAIHGADYLVVDHDGTWQDIISQVEEIHTAAADADKPVVLVIDSMTAEWEMLKDWASKRARESKFAKAKLREDVNAEIKPSMNLWNDAGDRHQKLMRLLMTFPGIVVVTARGKDVAALDKDGKPIPNTKDYRVEGHKTLPYDASVWVRLSRDEPPTVVGCRSVHSGIRPGVDSPLRYPEFSLEHLIFEVLKIDVAATQAREVTELVSDEKHLADEARSELLAWCQSNQVDPKQVAARFLESQGEELRATLDPSAVRNLLQALQAEQLEKAS
ncbi:AAA family ATPase [Mycolicibacter heraklionensis]|uniref:AAA family ATPase n=1 Tax=Mycolicibacter heraklionensis TaxID=512402 RepID=UPI0009E26926|nr:AAA family ATPase [Mycolicibacter heraklionensis]